MAQTKVSVRTLHNAPAAVGWAGHRKLTIDRAEDVGGMGLGYNGLDLLPPFIPLSQLERK